MTHARFKIVGGRSDQRLLTGKDVKVIVVTPDGQELLVPALSLTLRIGSPHEMAVATVEVPAVLVNLDGVRVDTVAVVDPSGPESQFEAALGKGLGTPIADVEHYAEPHKELLAQRIATTVDGKGPPRFSTELDLSDIHIIDAQPPIMLSPGLKALAEESMVKDIVRDYLAVKAIMGEVPIAAPDPMAELDAVIAAGGDVTAVLPSDDEDK